MKQQLKIPALLAALVLTGVGCCEIIPVPLLCSAEAPNQPSGPYQAACGNFTADANEQCDDGNQTNNDGCSDTCQIEPTAPLPPQQTSTGCIDEPTVANQDACWRDKAVAEQNPSYCLQLSTQGGQNLCYRDTEDCGSITGNINLRDQCWNDLAHSTPDVQLCDNILEPLMRQQCQLDLATVGSVSPADVFVGSWQFDIAVSNVTGTACANKIGEAYIGTMVISKNGDEFTVTENPGPNQLSFTGSLEGNQLSFSGSYPEESGTTSHTTTLTLKPDGTVLILVNWTWNGPGGPCTNGVTTGTATKLN